MTLDYSLAFLLPTVMAHEVHQNDCSYVRELSAPIFDSPCKNLACIVGGYKTDLVKLKNRQNSWSGRLPGAIR